MNRYKMQKQEKSKIIAPEKALLYAIIIIKWHGR